VIVFAAGSQARRARISDLSAGGFGFDAQEGGYKVGEVFRGSLHFTVEPVGFTLPVKFQVRNCNERSHHVGVQFMELGPHEISVLRHLITCYLSGELVPAGEVLATVARDNFSSPREQKAAAGGSLSGPARVRAVAATVAMFVLGLGAFAYTASKLYQVVFITHATAAKIAAPSFTITMPRDGTFFSLIPPDGAIKKGQPLGTFQAAMLDVVQTDPGSLHLTPQQLSDLMGETLKGTLSSPCDCHVHRQFAQDAQYVNRNQPLFELLPDDAKPYVLARFHFDSINELPLGRRVEFYVNGERMPRAGRIARLRLLPSPVNAAESAGPNDLNGLNNNGAYTDVIVEIEPDVPLERSLLEQPVDVTLGGMGVLSRLGVITHGVGNLASQAKGL
jgi:alginate biosynthesis protein Alg44